MVHLGEWANFRTTDDENERGVAGTSPASSTPPKEGSAPTLVLDRRPPGIQISSDINT